MIAYFLSKLITIFYGMLYPAYCSYKAVKTKDVKEYVHWMMYWIVFSIFSVFEVVADTFIGLWFPFYYELKILFMIWLLSPSTRGGSTMYRRFIHPFFTRHEKEIDGYLAEFKMRTSNLIVNTGTRAFSYVTDLFMSAVLRGGGGEFMNKVTRTYSYENFGQPDVNRNNQLPALRNEDDVDGTSDMEYALSSGEPEPRANRRRNPYSPNMRYSAVDEQPNRMGDMGSKPYSMMDLTEYSQQQPPKSRTSTRKKKEYGEPLVTPSPRIPVVFGWYPPDRPDMQSPIMSTPFSPQEFSRLPFSLNNPSELFYSSAQKLLESQQIHFISTNTVPPSDNASDDDSSSEDFFECDSENDDSSKPDHSVTSTKVHIVSKTVLREFDKESISTRKPKKEDSPSSKASKQISSSSSSFKSFEMPKRTRK